MSPFGMYAANSSRAEAAISFAQQDRNLGTGPTRHGHVHQAVAIEISHRDCAGLDTCGGGEHTLETALAISWEHGNRILDAISNRQVEFPIVGYIRDC